MSKLLAMMMNKKYTRLEYIESTGTQYIDTGLTNTAIAKAEYSFSITSNITEVHAIAGSYNSNGSNYFGLVRLSDNKLNYRVRTAFVPCGDVVELNTKYNVDVDIQSNSQSMTCNGVTVTSTYNAVSASNNIYLFKINDLSATGLRGRIYYFKLWQNGTLVRDLVPVIRNSDNEIGMLDRVSGQFFGNVGTGNFIGA